MRVVLKRPGYAPYMREVCHQPSLVAFAGKELKAAHVEPVRFNEAGIFFYRDADGGPDVWDRPVNFEHSDGFIYGPVMFYREIAGKQVEMTDEHIASVIRFFESGLEPDGLQKASEELGDEIKPDGWEDEG